MRDVTRRARAVMSQVWRIGERKFRGNFRRRMMLFNIMVKTILFYGVEIWGVKEWNIVEGMQVKYLKWIMGLHRCTPGYIVRQEAKVEKLNVEAGRIVLIYRGKIKETGNKVLRECRKDMDRKASTETAWVRDNEKMLGRAEMSLWEWEARTDRGEDTMAVWCNKMDRNEKSTLDTAVSTRTGQSMQYLKT